MSYFLEALQKRRLRLRIESLARRNNFKLTDQQVEAVIDEGATEYIYANFNGQYEGPIADLFIGLIQDMIENPEKWIKIIQTIIALFAS